MEHLADKNVRHLLKKLIIFYVCCKYSHVPFVPVPPPLCYKAGKPKLSYDTEGGEKKLGGEALWAQQINLIMFGKQV